VNRRLIILMKKRWLLWFLSSKFKNLFLRRNHLLSRLNLQKRDLRHLRRKSKWSNKLCRVQLKDRLDLIDLKLWGKWGLRWKMRGRRQPLELRMKTGNIEDNKGRLSNAQKRQLRDSYRLNNNKEIRYSN
jgi:hypothetical protein